MPKTVDLIGIHVYNDGIHTLNDLINNIVERILIEINPESWSDKIFNAFNTHIESVGFLSANIKFRPKKMTLQKILEILSLIF